MATGSLTVSITVPDFVYPNGLGDSAARAIAEGALQQAAAALGSGAALSGNLTYPPGQGTQVIGSWAYTPPT
jgi:hypothetical protein